MKREEITVEKNTPKGTKCERSQEIKVGDKVMFEETDRDGHVSLMTAFSVPERVIGITKTGIYKVSVLDSARYRYVGADGIWPLPKEGQERVDQYGSQEKMIPYDKKRWDASVNKYKAFEKKMDAFIEKAHEEARGVER